MSKATGGETIEEAGLTVLPAHRAPSPPRQGGYTLMILDLCAAASKPTTDCHGETYRIGLGSGEKEQR